MSNSREKVSEVDVIANDIDANEIEELAERHSAFVVGLALCQQSLQGDRLFIVYTQARSLIGFKRGNCE